MFFVEKAYTSPSPSPAAGRQVFIAMSMIESTELKDVTLKSICISHRTLARVLPQKGLCRFRVKIKFV